MLQAPGRLRTAAVISLTAALFLTGCDGSDPEPVTAPAPSASPSPSTAASPSASPGTPVEPEAPRPPKARRGPSAQKAFAGFVMDAWSWSLLTNDATPLLEASTSPEQPCDGCVALERELGERAKEGWYVDFPGLTVERTRLRRTGDTVVATSKVSIPESDSLLADGSYRSTSPAHEDATFTVTMRLARGGYRLVSFVVA